MISGSSVVWMGNYIIDTDLFMVFGISILVWDIKDFASNLLLLKWASYEMIEKLSL